MTGRYTLYIFTIFLWTISQAIYHLPQPVIDYMGSRQMRYQHLLWHNIRNSWSKLGSSTRNDLAALGWNCPRPSQTSGGDALENNLSGEDFLYMHRQMLNTARNLANNNTNWTNLPGENSLLLFSAWSTFPPQNSADYPVTPVYDSGNAETNDMISQWKAASIYSYMQSKETQFKDPNYLKTVTLGQLGSRMEFTLHNGLHVRWSDASSGIRNRPANPVPNIDAQWDNQSYVWLIDSYASAVNPYFYKIHAWIDARVEDWRRANGLSTINWQGTWTGGPTSSSNLNGLFQVGRDHHLRVEGAEIPAPGSSGMGMDNMNMEEGASLDILDKVYEILEKAGVDNSGLYTMVRCSENRELFEKND